MPRTHLALAVLVAAIWGLNFVVIEVGLEDFPPLLLSALRYALAALPLIVLGGMPAVPWRWVLAVGVAIGVVKFSLLFIGMDVGMPAGLASLVLQAQALFTVVLAAAVLGERIAGSQVAGLAIAFGGLALVATGLDGRGDAGGLRAGDRGGGRLGRRQPRAQARGAGRSAALHDDRVRGAARCRCSRSRSPSRARARSGTRWPGPTRAGSAPSSTSRSRPPPSAGGCGAT